MISVAGCDLRPSNQSKSFTNTPKALSSLARTSLRITALAFFPALSPFRLRYFFRNATGFSKRSGSTVRNTSGIVSPGKFQERGLRT